MLLYVRRLGVLVLVALAVLLSTLKRTDKPTVDCATAEGAGPAYKILVVGESWAAYGRILPELPTVVADRLQGRRTTACSIGFSGRNSKLLYHELREKFPIEKIYGLFGGAKPDKVIFMTGVNDIIQHVGKSNYVEYTKKLTEYFAQVKDIEIVSIPRVNERKFKSPTLFSAVKRFILRCFYDYCDVQINDVYRIALWRDHPELHVIEYDDFIDQYEGTEQCYTEDGVHLTDFCFHQYGVFIGGATSLRKEAFLEK